MTREEYEDVGTGISLRYRTAFKYLARIYGWYLGAGRARIAFPARDGRSVIKLPMNAEGERANERELKPDAWIGSPERSAKAWVDKKLTKRFGFPIIRMERVRPTRSQRLPSWTKAVDCQQVGYTKDRRLVAYDWGNT